MSTIGLLLIGGFTGFFIGKAVGISIGRIDAEAEHTYTHINHDE